MSDQLAGVKVGDVLYVAPHRYQLRSGEWSGPDVPEEWTVVKVGRKWITAVPSRYAPTEGVHRPNHLATQFAIADGRQNSDYNRPPAYTPDQWAAREEMATAKKRWEQYGFHRGAIGGDPTRGLSTREAAALYDDLADVVARHFAAAGVPTKG